MRREPDSRPLAALVDALVEGLPQAPPLAASTASAGVPPAAAAAANNTSDPNTWKVAMARFAGELQSAQKALTQAFADAEQRTRDRYFKE